jgi:hypothetical protein
MLNDAKVFQLCQSYPFLPIYADISTFAKLCQNHAKVIGLCPSYAKLMKLC